MSTFRSQLQFLFDLHINLAKNEIEKHLALQLNKKMYFIYVIYHTATCKYKINKLFIIITVGEYNAFQRQYCNLG